MTSQAKDSFEAMSETTGQYTAVLSPVGERGSAVLHIESAVSSHDACDIARNEIETEYLGTEWRVIAVFSGYHEAVLLGEDT